MLTESIQGNPQVLARITLKRTKGAGEALERAVPIDRVGVGEIRGHMEAE